MLREAAKINRTAAMSLTRVISLLQFLLG
jgi:hypothetical protein